MLKNRQVFSSTIEVLLLAPALYLVSQTRPTSAKREGSGELHRQAVSRCTVQRGTQSHCSILSHDALHDCLSIAIAVWGIFSTTAEAVKILHNASRERAYSATGKFKSALLDIWLHHPADCIPVGHGLYTQFNRPFPFFVEVGWACEIAD